MSLLTKTVLLALAGALAGLLLPLLHGQDMPFLLRTAGPGVLLGLLLGLVEAVAADDTRQKAASLVFGLVGGLAGVAAVQCALWILPAASVLLSACYTALLGLLIGLGLGAARRSWTLARQCGAGGLLGGLAAGVPMTILWGPAFPASPMPGSPTWLVGAFAVTGLGIGLLPLVRKPAWVRVKREGHSFGEEQILARQTTTFGALDTCDVTLRGDPRVAPVHAVVEAIAGQKRHKVRAMAGGADGFATLCINDRPVLGEQWLADGDCFQIGPFWVAYHEWASRGALRLGPARPQVWTQATGVWQMTEMITAHPAPGVAVPPPPPGTRGVPPPMTLVPTPEPAAPETSLLGLSKDSAPLSPFANAEPPTPLPGAILRGESGPYVGRAFWLGPGNVPVTIGRALERDISLSMDTSVSRLHARIVFDGGQHIVSDAGSANGTFVNGQRVLAPRPLHIGDLIGLGGTALRYG